MDYQKNARVFKALCDENRWKILDLLKNGEQCGCVLLNKLDISQSTLSPVSYTHLTLPTICSV